MGSSPILQNGGIDYVVRSLGSLPKEVGSIPTAPNLYSGSSPVEHWSEKPCEVVQFHSGTIIKIGFLIKNIII